MADLSNADVADTLVRYAQLLELGGENPFRVRAYHRAADAIRYHPEPIDEVGGRHALTEIPGVGPGIAAAVAELLEKGEFGPLVSLQEQVPITLLDLLAIPGVGTKTVIRLHTELGIVDLAGLEAAIVAGRLRGVPGLGDKLAIRILSGIEELRRRTGRRRLGTLLPVGRALVAELESVLPAGSRVSIAGSTRRWEETVGDIDIVVGAADPRGALRLAEELPAVALTLSGGDLDRRLRLQSGVDVDLYAAPLDRFGDTLVRATGNADHLALLGNVPPAATEEDVYASLGLPVVPPELRQGLDELDLVRAGGLADLVTLADIGGEFHAHTLWSDGAATVSEMAAAARAHGYAFLGISDHSRSLGVANGLDVDRLRAQRVEIDGANVASGIRVFASAEVEVHRDATLDFDDATLAALDVVIASTHSGLRQSRATLTDRLLRVLANPHVDIVAHPSGRLLEQREGGDFDWPRVFEAAARAGTALEINADPARLDLSPDRAREALAAGCLLTLNCDAHHPTGFALMEYGVAMARRAGARPDQILNAWPLSRIESWLASRA